MTEALSKSTSAYIALTCLRAMHYCSEAFKRNYEVINITQAETTTTSKVSIGLLEGDHRVLHYNNISMPTCDRNGKLHILPGGPGKLARYSIKVHNKV